MYKRTLVAAVVAAIAYFCISYSHLPLTIKQYFNFPISINDTSSTSSAPTMALASISRTVAKKVYAVETPEVSAYLQYHGIVSLVAD